MEIFNDSQLVVYQVLGEYQAKGLRMVQYLNKVKDLLTQFKRYSITQVPREKIANADALAKLASAKDADTLNVVPVEYLAERSITEQEALPVELGDTWMTPIINYLNQGVVPSDRNKTRKLVRQAARYMM